MPIDLCTKADFDQILAHIVDFWGSDRTLHLHQPMFLHEFGDTAYVIRSGDEVAAYLFAFITRNRLGYCHLLGCREQYRRHGLARQLYLHFFEVAEQAGCTHIKAITTPTNDRSIAFHHAMGFTSSIVPDYSGPGQDRVIFQRPTIPLGAG